MSEHISEEQYSESNNAKVGYSRYEEAIQRLQEELRDSEQILSQLKATLEKEEIDFAALENFNKEAGEEGDRELPPELMESTYLRITELKDAILQKERAKRSLEESIKRDRLLEDLLTEVLKRYPYSSKQ